MTAVPEAHTSVAAPRPSGFRGSTLQLWLSTGARLVLAGVLFAAGGLKLLHPDEAARAVRAYEILPVSWGQAFGIGIPLVEIAVAVLLVLGIATRVAAALTVVIMVVFIAAIVSAWARGLSIDCGCFGGGGAVDPEGKTWRYVSEILRDLGFIALAAWLLAYPRSHWSLAGYLAVDDPGEDPAADDPDSDDGNAEEADG